MSEATQQVKRAQNVSVWVRFSVAVPLGIWSAWVIVQLWSWFVVPAFELPALTVPLVFGLRLVWVVFTSPGSPEPKQFATKAEVWADLRWRIQGLVFGPLIALGIGTIVRWFL
jgi:hypothetical protein